jgi:hypothetical protein
MEKTETHKAEPGLAAKIERIGPGGSQGIDMRGAQACLAAQNADDGLESSQEGRTDSQYSSHRHARRIAVQREPSSRTHKSRIVLKLHCMNFNCRACQHQSKSQVTLPWSSPKSTSVATPASLVMKLAHSTPRVSLLRTLRTIRVIRNRTSLQTMILAAITKRRT